MIWAIVFAKPFSAAWKAVLDCCALDDMRSCSAEVEAAVTARVVRISSSTRLTSSTAPRWAYRGMTLIGGSSIRWPL
ncbi:hypothetical protein D9M70_653100 [compost metagenome]